MSEEVVNLAKAYIVYSNTNPHLAEGVLESALLKARELPFREFKRTLDYVLSQENLPQWFLREMKFEYYHRGGSD